MQLSLIGETVAFRLLRASSPLFSVSAFLRPELADRLLGGP